MTIVKPLLICELILALFVGIQSQEIGQPCTVRRTGGAGTCTKVYSCAYADRRFREERRPNFCKLGNLRNVVCCPNEDVNSFRRISERKCAEYASAVYVTIAALPLMANATTEYVTKDKCVRRVQPLITGGRATQYNEFPHMALIGFGVTNTQWTCVGALISERFVLTVAHCDGNYGRKPHYVRLGQLGRSFESSVQYNIERFIKHPTYRRRNNNTDIALIQLDREVKFRPNMRPACLPKYPDEPVDQLVITGWGVTDSAEVTGWGVTDYRGGYSNGLLTATLEKFSIEECQQFYEEFNSSFSALNPTTHICAGSRIYNRGSCQGDSWGPLQIYHYSQYCMYTVIGITSTSASFCGNESFPVLFSNVVSYLDWIENIVWL